MKKILATLFLALLVILAISPEGQADPIELKGGHAAATDHPYHLGLMYLGQLVKERTNGELTLKVYPDAMLGSEQELVGYLQMGMVDFAVISTSPLSGFTNSLLIFDLPFLFPDSATARRVLDGPFGQETLAGLKDIDLVGITFFENGFRHLTNSKRQIVFPDDLRGLKIRTMQSKVYIASFQALGAIASPLPFGELYSALEHNAFDGQENPLPIIYTSKFYESQKYCSLTGHAYSPSPLLLSPAAWESLSEKHREIFLEAAAEAREYERQQIDEQAAENIAKLKEVGMEITEVDRSIWAEAMSSVYDTFAPELGEKVIERALMEIAKSADSDGSDAKIQ
ncbi:MAG: DctP family TRAP transporter solute-binding subunit [Deltaproteobacteria bacterium]|jgi:tripartite ATP-independent transporter DctP family solute receptor|nr:DctP family TRAP transporter solute-binding subunit [Deltaproteobacteria bacterium]